MTANPVHIARLQRDIPAQVGEVENRTTGHVDAVSVILTILGQPYSKANSRKIVTLNGHAASIKSSRARDYERQALRQIPARCRLRLEGPLCVTMRIYYASERPDLDESLILDILQDRWTGSGKNRVLVQAGVYRNDRQVREKHILHSIDRANPRTMIVVKPREFGS